MPSRADVEDLRRLLNALSARAKADLTRLWSQLPTNDLTALRKALEVAWPELLGQYGEVAAAVAADVFEGWATDLGLTPKTTIVRPVDADRANGRMRWAIGQPEAFGNMVLILDELVKQPARRTIQRSAEASGGAWARVPSGSDTCKFCIVLASRGAVYASKESATTVVGRGKTKRSRGTRSLGAKYHGGCNCQAILVRDEGDYPKGYDPDALYDRYDAARSATGSGDLKAILSQMRQQDGTH